MPEINSIEENAIKVKSLRSLREEKARLKLLRYEIEKEGRKRRDHVKHHWVSMTLNSVLSNRHPEKRIFDLAAEGAKNAWESTNFRSVLINGAVTFIEFIAVRQGVKLFDKYFKKKERR